MKKLHKLVFKTYFGPFLVTFIVSNFLLLMIWMVKYLEDIIGKGLDFIVIFEMIARGSLNQIPFSLPLAILLSSIMTYGKLGETIELTAMKSLGVSLTKAMRPLLVFTVGLAIGAYFFANNYLPYSNKKLSSLMSDITRTKPELLIPEGVFYNNLKGYTIRIGKKYRDKSIADVLIFDDSNDGKGGFVAADSGSLELSKNGNHLILNLINGNTYKLDKEKIRPGTQRKLPFVKNQFSRNRLIFELTGFTFEKSDPNKRSKHLKNMSNSDIAHHKDSLELKQKKEAFNIVNHLHYKYFFIEDTTFLRDTVTAFSYNELIGSIDSIEDSKRKIIQKTAKETASKLKRKLEVEEKNKQNGAIYIGRHSLEIHKKYSNSIACIIMFFIGAPFGAIVRKGGLGLPVVIGVLLFLLYYVLSTTMYKMGKKGDFDPIWGMWLAPLILSPVGLFLTYKAATDSSIFRKEAYKAVIKRLFKKK